jgi:hypothetical protein
MRLSESPETPVQSHTKMFELIHMVTSMDDFGPYPLALYRTVYLVQEYDKKIPALESMFRNSFWPISCPTEICELTD